MERGEGRKEEREHAVGDHLGGSSLPQHNNRPGSRPKAKIKVCVCGEGRHGRRFGYAIVCSFMQSYFSFMIFI